MFSICKGIAKTAIYYAHEAFRVHKCIAMLETFSGHFVKRFSHMCKVQKNMEGYPKQRPLEDEQLIHQLLTIKATKKGRHNTHKRTFN